MTVAYTEEQGSPVAAWTNQGLTITRTLICAWDDRYDLMAEFRGTSLDNSIGTIGYTTGFCVSPSCEPILGENIGAADNCAYELARVIIPYTEFGGGNNIIQDDYSEALEPNAEFLTLNYLDYRWSIGTHSGILDLLPIREEEAPGKLFKGADYMLTHANLTTLPTGAFNLIGTVNTAKFDTRTTIMGGISFAPETLLFQVPTIEYQTINGSGDVIINATYRLSYKPQGWNKFWRPESNAYEYMYEKTVGPAPGYAHIKKLIYPLASFTGL